MSTGLSNTIKYVRRAASGAAGNGLGTTAKYLRRTRNDAAGNRLATKLENTSIRQAASLVLAIQFAHVLSRDIAVPIRSERYSKTGFGKVLIVFSDKSLTCRLKEGIKAV
jgi:hypothetical protein